MLSFWTPGKLHCIIGLPPGAALLKASSQMPTALDISTHGCTLRLLTQRHLYSNALGGQ